MTNIIIFLVSILLCSIIIFILNKLFYKIKLPNSLGRIERHHIHEKKILRIGGFFFLFCFYLILIINYLISNYFFSITSNLFLFLIFSFIYFIVGFIDDLIEYNNVLRFIILFALSLFSVIFFDFQIYGLFESSEIKVNYFFKVVFTSFCLFVLLISFNIIDGLNGLIVLYSIIIFAIFLTLKFIFLNSLDYFLIVYLIVLFSVLFYNFPNANYFMGDGFAYFIAFSISYFTFDIHNKIFPIINEWFFACIFAFPVIELFFSFSRRLFIKNSIFSADKLHLHYLLLNYLTKRFSLPNQLSNPLTSIIIILFIVIYMIILLAINYYNDLYLIYLFFSYLFFYFMINLFLIKKNI